MSSTTSHENHNRPEGTPTPTIVEGKEEKTVTPKSDDGNEIMVDWDGPQDPANPKLWTFKEKWAATTIVSLFTFISPVSSSMIAPATEIITQQFEIKGSVQAAMVTSIFGRSGLCYWPSGPLSEIYGRSRVLQLANLFYLVWNLACGFAQSEVQLIVFRFLAGLGGSAPLAVGGGVLGDVWLAEERGKAIAVYSLAPLLGPVIGPLTGAWIAQRSTWRWVFWSTSMVDAAIQVAGVFFLRETFPPVLLERKAKRIRKSLAADPEKAGSEIHVRTVYDSDHRTWQSIFSKALTRPFTLFAREPIAQIIGVYIAFVYGIFYCGFVPQYTNVIYETSTKQCLSPFPPLSLSLSPKSNTIVFLTTIPSIFSNVYHEAPGIAGLNYLAFGVGLTFASQINARYMDKIYVYYKNKNGGVGEPEFRVPSMILGSFLLPIGLFMSGWAAENAVHWIVTDIGMVFVASGVILSFQTMQTYVVDCFTLHAASALAAVSCLRSFAGFGFPLFAPTMYDKLGYGVGNSILGAVAIVIGWPAPLLFWKYGKAIRGASKYAKKSS
ncbi:hypothetical protein D9758_008632 [Tetrapyrgos nigripes]|uniref:Major facilitator superfamily (MFS) profile domain-containing protein n=1 Tax=Tetrapyrgos nigripes TaxID=182062 RepID=A0A8H5D5X2_9AGAR|nr:hypothetical protein D9758_008632 [Tetrapyrgos nigripes]